MSLLASGGTLRFAVIGRYCRLEDPDLIVQDSAIFVYSIFAILKLGLFAWAIYFTKKAVKDSFSSLVGIGVLLIFCIDLFSLFFYFTDYSVFSFRYFISAAPLFMLSKGLGLTTFGLPLLFSVLSLTASVSLLRKMKLLSVKYFALLYAAIFLGILMSVGIFSLLYY